MKLGSVSGDGRVPPGTFPPPFAEDGKSDPFPAPLAAEGRVGAVAGFAPPATSEVPSGTFPPTLAGEGRVGTLAGAASPAASATPSFSPDTAPAPGRAGA